MAFPQPNAQRDLASRKILEEIQLKKQILLKQGVASTLNSPLSLTNAAASDGNSLTTTQRNLQALTSQSTGFFIVQESTFGNAILPVLPRLEANSK